jgi:hypothetical protein
MRSALLGLMLASVAGVAVAQDWGNMAVISSTLGNNTKRLCIGDHARPGDIGCPTWAPSLTTAGDLSVTGNLSAAKFIGDGSGLTNVGAASTDRITSGTTSMLAISSTGYVSLTQSGTNTGWFDPTRGLVTIGVSSTGPISATAMYSSGYIQANTTVYTTNVVAASNGNYYWGNTSSGLGIGGNSTAGNQYLTLFTSGTEAMRIVSSGQVGIGTSTPGAALDIKGNSASANANTVRVNWNSLQGNASYIVNRNLNTNNAAVSFQTTGTSNWNVGLTDATHSTSSTDFDISDGVGNYRFHILGSNGNVGIGTAAPNAKLEVSGTISATNFVGNGSGLTNLPAGSVTAGTSGSIIYRDAAGNLTAKNTFLIDPATGMVVGGAAADSATLLTVGSTANGSGNVVLRRSTGLEPSIAFFSGSNTGVSATQIRGLADGGIRITDGSSSNEYVRVVSGGFVGVGTASPSFKLDVNGVVRSTSYAQATGFYVSATGSGINSVAGPNTLSFRTSTTDNRMIIDSSGNVGISTTSPNAKLDVYGTISATNLVVNGVSITGSGSTGDRIVSGSVSMIAEQTSGTVRISGTLALQNTGNEPCDAAHWYTFRADPVTQQLEMCRP